MQNTVENKYKINDLLGQLPRLEEQKASRILPGLLGVSLRTYQNWKSIPKKSSKSIPGDALIRLAQFFGVSVNDLYHEVPKLEAPQVRNEKHANSQIENL